MFLNKFKIFFISIFLLLLSSCDFRVPQEWETPSWEFDLLIPLINDQYSMETISSSSNDIEITTPDSLNFIIELNEVIIDSGYVQTDESFFIIPNNNIAFEFDETQIPNPSPMPDIPPLNEEITIQDFIGEQDISCLPLDILESDIYDTIEISIDSFCEDIGDVECMNKINWLKIDEGENILTINNTLPFQINELSLNIFSDEGDLVDLNLINIEGERIEEDPLNGEVLGCEVAGGNLSFKINRDLQASSTSNECNLYQIGCELYGQENNVNTSWDGNDCQIFIIINQEICQETGLTWRNDECVQDFLAENEAQCDIIDELEDEDLEWDGENCYFVIVMDAELCNQSCGDCIWDGNDCSLSCTSNEECCLEIGGTWEGGECIDLPSFDGVFITGNEKIEISNEFNIESFESLSADIDCLIDTSYSVELPTDENMILIQGHISDLTEDDTGDDINQIALDLTNNLFSDITFIMFSDNLFDPDGVSLKDTQTVSTGLSFEDVIISDYTIKNENGDPVDLLSIGYSIQMQQDSAIINFDEPYGLSGQGIESKTIKLDELKVNLNEFSTSDIDLGNIPSGFEGFDLPFLTFDLHIYNQISADMKLYLDLFGIRDDDTLKIHVEPDINFLDELDPYVDIDSLIISFRQDIMSVLHFGNKEKIPIHNPEQTTLMEHKITDLFSYDIIDISGYAVMDGDATLIPDKSLWGDVEIVVSPLTIIIEDEDIFSFVPDEFTELSVMDRDIATKVDSGLVSAVMNMNINNQIPFAGNLLMYISNSPTYFPLCMDSLITGDMQNQNVDSLCISNIENYLGCNTLNVTYDEVDTLFVKHLDCITDNNYNYYYENLLNIDFISPTLDSLGIVLDSAMTHQSTTLEEQINYFTRDSLQYLIPRFVFDSDLDTITFQPSNILSINSHLIFKLLSSGILDEE